MSVSYTHLDVYKRQDEYYTRVKAKFTGPVAERFFDTGALCALLDDHRACKTNAMTKIWAFYCFIEWYEVYLSLIHI